ncbi:MAG: hypothetical protein KGL39_52615 [Patescibacteria group bacterium]|nr:hypothetical protein [Patescibacteria group bacterium]
MPAEKELPAPPDDYFEMETAKLHGGWPGWCGLPAQMRGKLMAHELHKNMREHYYFDMKNPDEQSKAEKPKAPWDAAREKFFGGQPTAGGDRGGT